MDYIRNCIESGDSDSELIQDMETFLIWPVSPSIMDIKEIQTKVVNNVLEYGKKNNIKIDEDFALLKLYEEVGEFAQAILIHRKKCRKEKYVSEEVSKKELAKELADVMGMVMVNAHLLKIDLADSIDKKWINKEK